MSQSEIALKPFKRSYSFLIGYGVIVPKHAFVSNGAWADVDSTGTYRKRPREGSFDEKLNYFLHSVLPPLSCNAFVLEDGSVVVGYQISHLYPSPFEAITMPPLSDERMLREKTILYMALEPFGLWWDFGISHTFRYHKLFFELESQE